MKTSFLSPPVPLVAGALSAVANIGSIGEGTGGAAGAVAPQLNYWRSN